MLVMATEGDVAYLRDEVLVAAADPTGARAVADLRADDHVARYVDGWGRPGDLGVVAWTGGQRTGAAWVRLMGPDRPGYGFVDEATPELTVGVGAAHRGGGLGRSLVAGVLDLAAVHGHPRVSLSVADALNPVAVGLYRSLGFREVGRDPGGSLTMVADTAPLPPSATGRTVRPAVRWATAADGPALRRARPDPPPSPPGPPV